MKIGILEADHVADELVDQHGTYPDMFKALLKNADEALEFAVYTVIDNEFPTQFDCDAYLITGSKFSAYEDVPWIHRLKTLIQELYEQRIPLMGICFGHQLIAIALGGHTGKAPQGWGVGCYESNLVATPEWMAAPPDDNHFTLLVSHQDQVIELPANATLIGTNDFCPNAMYQVGDTVLTFQGHPEFSPAYDKALMNKRREIIGETTYQNGVASLVNQEQGDMIASWMVDFVKSALKK